MFYIVNTQTIHGGSEQLSLSESQLQELKRKDHAKTLRIEVTRYGRAIATKPFGYTKLQG